VNNIDATSVQALIDVRNQLDRYSAPDTVDWHFANITNRWTKRGLAAADGQTQAIFSIAELMGQQNTPSVDVKDKKGSDDDIENMSAPLEQRTPLTGPRQIVVQGLNRPLFHFDLQEAVEAAVVDARTKTF
jgi:sodium-independent sulfate anion transporter 11